MNFDNIACAISCILGIGIGLFIGELRCSSLYHEYDSKLQKQERINKKLIFFIKFKLDECVKKRIEENEED